MSLYEEHMKFANDVLRIRNAMVDEELDERLRIFWDYRQGYDLKCFKIHGKEARPHFFGDISSIHYDKSHFSNLTVITSKSIVYMHDDRPAWMTIESTPEQQIDIIEYDEATHFQHSLLYSDKQLKALVVASVLRANPIMLKRDNTLSPYSLRFKIYWHYVPTIIKLMRYKDNGII